MKGDSNMSWVSYTKLKELCDAMRTKFISNELVIANSDKSLGAHLNIGGQDGLVTVSPITEDGVTPAALWVTDSEANNATELTGGTLSYVTNNGKATEDYTSLSLVGGVVNVSGKSGAQRRITNVATPTGDNDVANKKYVDDNVGGLTIKHFYTYDSDTITLTPAELDFTIPYFCIINAKFTVASNGTPIRIQAEYNKTGTYLDVCNGYYQMLSGVGYSFMSTPYMLSGFTNVKTMDFYLKNYKEILVLEVYCFPVADYQYKKF